MTYYRCFPLAVTCNDIADQEEVMKCNLPEIFNPKQGSAAAVFSPTVCHFTLHNMSMSCLYSKNIMSAWAALLSLTIYPAACHNILSTTRSTNLQILPKVHPNTIDHTLFKHNVNCSDSNKTSSRTKQNVKWEQPTCIVVSFQGPGSASMLGSSPSSTGFPPEDHSRSSAGSSLPCSHSAWWDCVEGVNVRNFYV